MSLQNCATELIYHVTCSGEICPDDSWLTIYQPDDTNDYLEINIQTDDESSVGTYLIEVQAFDLLNGHESEIETLSLHIFDPCVDQSISISAFATPPDPVVYLLRERALQYNIEASASL